MDFLTKAQAIQIACSNVKNVSCSVSSYNVVGSSSHYQLAIYFWFDGNIVGELAINSFDANAEHRINMIIKHGLFGRIKVEK